MAPTFSCPDLFIIDDMGLIVQEVATPSKIQRWSATRT
jgi:hypothetical protein